MNKQKMSNKEWIDFLSIQFDISRNSAKKMLHYMFIVKLEDNIKRQYEKGGKYKWKY